MNIWIAVDYFKTKTHPIKLLEWAVRVRDENLIFCYKGLNIFLMNVILL